MRPCPLVRTSHEHYADAQPPNSCPYCANNLTIGKPNGPNKWVCATCPYEYPINVNVRPLRLRAERESVGSESPRADPSTPSSCSTLSGLISRGRKWTMCWAEKTAGRTWTASKVRPLSLFANAEQEADHSSPPPTVACKKECGNERAFYMQLQIRSADEPMTTFYRCVGLLVVEGERGRDRRLKEGGSEGRELTPVSVHMQLYEHPLRRSMEGELGRRGTARRAGREGGYFEGGRVRAGVY